MGGDLGDRQYLRPSPIIWGENVIETYPTLYYDQHCVIGFQAKYMIFAPPIQGKSPPLEILLVYT